MITVIIPIYNTEKYLNRCIESVVSQTYSDLEILLINDGSKDNSSVICSYWEKEDPRVIYIEKENEGLGPTRNYAVSLAKGEYITFLDSDDWWESYTAEKIQNTIIKTNADVIFFDYYYVYDADKEKVNDNKFAQRIAISSESGCFSVEQRPDSFYKLYKCLCNKAFNREFYVRNQFTQPSHAYEDIEILPHILYKAKKIYGIQDVLYNYYITRKGNITTSCENVKYLLEDLYDIQNYFYKEGEDEKYKGSLYRLSIHIIQDIFSRLQNDEPGRSFYKLEVENYLNEYYPETNTSINYTVLGSYNIYKAVCKYTIDTQNSIHFYTASSLISCMDVSAVDFDLSKVKHFNQNRELWVKNDLQRASSFYLKSDFLIIDFLEERYDIGVYKGAKFTISDFWQECQTSFSPNEIISNGTANYKKLWKKSCQKLIIYLKEKYEASNIFLIKLYYNIYKGEYEKKEKFEHSEMISEQNKMLKEFYEFFEESYPGITVVELNEEYCYCDTFFQYGCFPWNFNEFAYYELADKITHIINTRGKN